MRTKPPTTRTGKTTKYQLGACSVYVTVNGSPPLEIFCKADEGWQGWADVLAELTSVALQSGTEPETLARHLRHHRMEPEGGPGQPASIPDAIGRAIEAAGK